MACVVGTQWCCFVWCLVGSGLFFSVALQISVNDEGDTQLPLRPVKADFLVLVIFRQLHWLWILFVAQLHVCPRFNDLISCKRIEFIYARSVGSWVYQIFESSSNDDFLHRLWEVDWRVDLEQPSLRAAKDKPFPLHHNRKCECWYCFAAQSSLCL